MNRTVIDLLAGNAAHAGTFHPRFDDVQDAQHPDAVTVCCSDSRVLQDEMWGNETPGHLFTCGNIGNRVVQQTAEGRVVSGDVLYPLEHTGTEVAVVVGHTGCGAVTATYDAVTGELSDRPGIEHCVGVLKPLLEPGIERLPDEVERATTINRLVEYNVDRQVQFLLDSEDVSDQVCVVGGVYDFQDVYGGRRGEVHVVNVDGERDPDSLRASYPDLADRVSRLWTY